MTDTQDVERIRFKMQRIRRHMDEDVTRLQEDAAQLMNWKYYVLRHPIASLAAVAALGYAVVPKPRQVAEKKVYLDPETSREALLNSEGLQLDQGEKQVQKGLLFTLGTLAVTTLVKAGVNYAGQQIRQTLLQDFNRNTDGATRT